jgi:hypothetical protein
MTFEIFLQFLESFFMFFTDPDMISKEEEGLAIDLRVYTYGFEQKKTKERRRVTSSLFGLEMLRTVVVVVRSSTFDPSLSFLWTILMRN